MSYRAKSRQDALESDGFSDSPGDKQQDNAFATYLRVLSAFPVMKPEREFELAAQVEEAHLQLLHDYCNNIYEIYDENEELVGSEVPGFSLLEQACASGPELKGKFAKARQRILKAKNQKTVDKVASEIYAALPADGYDNIRAVASYITTVKKYGEEYPEFYEDVRLHHDRVLKLRNEFVRGNLRLVISIAKRFNFGQMPLLDLIQEGNIGLMKAVDRYDHRRGYRFSTYASWWIRHAISRAMADKSRTVRLPVHLIDFGNKANRTKRYLQTSLGRQPSPEEIVAHMGAGNAEAMLDKYQAVFAGAKPLSLDFELGSDDGRSFVDFIEDVNAVDSLQKIEDDEEIEKTLRVLNDPEALKPIEAEILRRRFGLGTGNAETLKEIGDDYNLSRERIRQIQETALLKLRRRLTFIAP